MQARAAGKEAIVREVHPVDEVLPGGKLVVLGL